MAPILSIFAKYTEKGLDISAILKDHADDADADDDNDDDDDDDEPGAWPDLAR